MKLFKTLMTATVLAGTALAPALAHAATARVALPFQPAGVTDTAEKVNFLVTTKSTKAKKGKRGSSNSNSNSNS
ncbi:MAG: hypothetical protein ACRC14_01850, partial [Paracoccaceae bacterium]